MKVVRCPGSAEGSGGLAQGTRGPVLAFPCVQSALKNTVTPCAPADRSAPVPFTR